MKRYLLLSTLLLTVIACYAETASLTMVHCDDGNYGLLPSPGDIDLAPLRTAFNANVDTLVFIHGFNNTPSAAKNAYTTAMGFIHPTMGNMNYVGFYWPSDTFPDFGQAVDHANKTGRYLVYVLENINSWYGGSSRRIHLISHSLGGRVLLSTLKENSIRNINLGHCFSMAAAVHSNVYQKSFSGTQHPPRGTLVYHSNGDWVLKYLYTLYYWLFERDTFTDSPEYAAWQGLSLDEKLAYMKDLEESAATGISPQNDFDHHLLLRIEEAEKQAMGLIGADLGSPKNIKKVVNDDVTNMVSGHSYWNNRQVMKKICAVLQNDR